VMTIAIRRFAVVMLALGAAQAVQPALAQAQSSLSDESVRKLMAYAWQQTPPRFTRPDNTVVVIDRNKPDAAMVPVDVARDVIIAARRSALAQICKLDEHQVANYRSMMLREVQKKKWSDQQVVFINMLHLTTVQIFAGDITIKLRGDGDKVIEETPLANKRAQSCTDAEATKLKEQIETYVNAGPLPEQGPPTAAAAAAPAPAAAPATPTTTGSTPAAKPAGPAGKGDRK
jgi:hypothetical protein